jgi:hypothetical protein
MAKAVSVARRNEKLGMKYQRNQMKAAKWRKYWRWRHRLMKKAMLAINGLAALAKVAKVMTSKAYQWHRKQRRNGENHAERRSGIGVSGNLKWRRRRRNGGSAAWRKLESEMKA